MTAMFVLVAIGKAAGFKFAGSTKGSTRQVRQPILCMSSLPQKRVRGRLVHVLWLTYPQYLKYIVRVCCCQYTTLTKKF